MGGWSLRGRHYNDGATASGRVATETLALRGLRVALHGVVMDVTAVETQSL